MRFLLTCTLTLLLFPCSLHAQVAEICTNGIDDDGDTLLSVSYTHLTLPVPLSRVTPGLAVRCTP